MILLVYYYKICGVVTNRDYFIYFGFVACCTETFAIELYESV